MPTLSIEDPLSVRSSTEDPSRTCCCAPDHPVAAHEDCLMSERDPLLTASMRCSPLLPVCIGGFATVLAIFNPALLDAQEGRVFREIESVVTSEYSSPVADLTWVSDLTVGSAGAVFVAQPLAHEVLVYSADLAALEHRIGRRGAGPGEFQFPRTLGWVGDSLWVRDTQVGRLSLFDEDRLFVTSFGRLGPEYQPGVFSQSAPLALLADFTLIAASLPIPAAVNRMGIEPVYPIWRLDADGAVRDTVAWIDNSDKHLVATWSDMQFNTTQPFADSPVWAVSRGGDGFAVARQYSEGVTVTVWTFESGREWTFDVVPDRIRLDRQVVDSVVESLAQRMTMRRPGASSARAESIMRDALHVPEYLPEVTSLRLDREGGIWIRRSGLPLESAVWDRYDHEGIYTFSIHQPARVELFDFSSGRAYGAEYDDLDVPQVVVYCITGLGC